MWKYSMISIDLIMLYLQSSLTRMMKTLLVVFTSTHIWNRSLCIDVPSFKRLEVCDFHQDVVENLWQRNGWRRCNGYCWAVQAQSVMLKLLKNHWIFPTMSHVNTFLLFQHGRHTEHCQAFAVLQPHFFERSLRNMF